MLHDFCNIDEATIITGWTKTTIYSKISRREIPSYRVGRSVRFKRSDLLKLFIARPALRTRHEGAVESGNLPEGVES